MAADDVAAAVPLPWLAEPLRRALASPRKAQALLVHGPAGVGQFPLALSLAQAWLCENQAMPLPMRPCGSCPSCRLVQARSHPDLLVLVPEALRESLGWTAASGDGDDGGDERSGKKKPSKDIRVEAVRGAVEFATTTSARGQGKVVVVHPAERMNPIAANAFLKTLEEPAGDARFVLCATAADALLPTIRSRCQSLPLPVPPRADAERWLEGEGVDQPGVLLDACGGQPEEVIAWRALGIDAAACRSFPGKVARGDASALHGLPLAVALDILQKVCHDAAAVACGAPPRYFPAAGGSGARLDAVLRWAAELRRVATEAEHPWSLDLGVESLVQQGREALKTARSPHGREPSSR